MSLSPEIINAAFPRTQAYNPDWIKSIGMGSHPLWMTEWLTSSIDLRPGMRVLDLGCGRAASSVFLAREFGVQVWAADLWINASENYQRIRDAGLSDRIFPIHCDAHALPFAGEFFDAITCIDCFSYFGTSDLYLNYLAHFVRTGGAIGVAGAGLMHELTDGIPQHLRQMWTQDFWCLHSAQWWRGHWERTGIVDMKLAETMTDGWKFWQHWQQDAYPQNEVEIQAITQDRGSTLGYIRMIATRRSDAKLEEYCWPDTLRSMPISYENKPILK